MATLPKSRFVAALFALIVALALSHSANAKVYNLSNPQPFDVGDYVQDGLVLHYDGIRNQGANAAHNASATTWANLGSLGSKWNLSRHKCKDGNTGSWTDYGYENKGYYNFRVTDRNPKLNLPNVYTMQTLVEANPTNKLANPMYASSFSWYGCAFALRTNKEGNLSANSFYFNNQGKDKDSYNLNQSPFILNDSHDYDYATAVLDATNRYSAMFSGTEIPADGNGRRTFDEDFVFTNYTHGGFTLCGYGGDDYAQLVGTMKSWRFYEDRVLSSDELKWNRIVDNARFFGIFETNVVVASTQPGLSGLEAEGAYTVDAKGYTFTSLTRRTLDGTRYVLAGYTIETWDGSAWSTPVRHVGNSFAATWNDHCRLTWLWKAERAWCEPMALEPVDYAGLDSIALHYDGIRNAGTNVEHSTTATTWKDLSPSENDATITVVNEGETKGGEWLADGYFFNAKTNVNNTDIAHYAYGRVQNAQDFGGNITFQVACNVTANQGTMNGLFPAIFGVQDNNRCNLYQDSGRGGRLEFKADKTTGLKYTTRANLLDWDGRYINAALSQDRDGKQILTPGTSFSSGWTNNVNSHTVDYPGSTMWGFGSAGFSDGATVATMQGAPNESNLKNRSLHGTINSIRVYTRVLTDDELAWNRAVDDARFFGVMATNAVVRSWPEYVKGDKNGYMTPTGQVYLVNEVGYTFTAPDVVTNMIYASDGTTATATNLYNRVGYVLEEWNEAGGAWGTPVTNKTGYCHVSRDDRVRITWLWRSATAIAKNNARAYVQDGLMLHYDGIRNQGLDAAHSDNATTWKNLGSLGSGNAVDLSKASASGGSGEWVADGYRFGGLTQFGTTESRSWLTTFSAQAVVDAKYADNTHANGNYIAATTWNQFGMQIWGSASNHNGRFNAQSKDEVDRCTFETDTKIEYMTVTHDLATKTVTVFPGTVMPTSGDGYRKFGTFNGIENNKFRLGGWGGGPNVQCLVGTVKNFRYYGSKILSHDELVWNRTVDDMRFSSETNIFVQVAAKPDEIDGADTPLATGAAYMVEPAGGTLNAPSDTYAFKGNTYRLRGYKLEVWDSENNEWGSPVYGLGTSIPVDAGARIRVTWQWRADGWLNPSDFDVDDYVQDGLILHYDGIRNVGAAEPHNSDTAEWKNVAPDWPGRYDLELYSPHADAGRPSTCRWNDEGNGFVFDGLSFFRWVSPDNDQNSPTYQCLTNRYKKLTMETLVDAKLSDSTSSDGISYLAVVDEWNKCSICMRKIAGGGTSANSMYLVADNYLNAHGGARPYFQAPDGDPTKPFRYVTVVSGEIVTNEVLYQADSSFEGGGKTVRAMCFDGVNFPKPGETGYYLANTNVFWVVGADLFYLGGYHSASKEILNGTIKSFRYYMRELSESELQWNRMVDNARFFGVMPTNTTVRSSLDFLSAYDEGDFAVGGVGHTFAAADTATGADGSVYELDGYALERWDGSSWGMPEIVRGTNAYFAAGGTNIVRLTWLWKETSAANMASAADYDVDDYVQDGLVLHYDGIRNVGADKAHDATARRWVNIAPGGGYELTLYSKDRTNPYDMWLKDGYHFGSTNAVFGYQSIGVPLTLTTSYTIQTAIDASSSEQAAGLDWCYKDNTFANYTTVDSGKIWGYVFFMPEGYDKKNEYWKMGSVSVRRDYRRNRMMFSIEALIGGDKDGHDRPFYTDPDDDYTQRNEKSQGMVFRYATAVIEDNTAYMFPGTAYPTKSSIGLSMATTSENTDAPEGSKCEGTKSAVATPIHRFYLGGKSNFSLDENLRGTIKNFRFYNRKLTEAELEKNRRVDNARLFGTVSATNAVIASLPGELGGVEPCGTYAVTNAAGHVFAAPSIAVDASGRVFRYSGRYICESWNDTKGKWESSTGAGNWDSSTVKTGSSILVTPSDRVRITWIYDDSPAVGLVGEGWNVGDYAQDGLVVHYDGIRNVGADQPHCSDSRFWRNVASDSYDMRRMRYPKVDGIKNAQFAYWSPLDGSGTTAGAWTDKGFFFDGKSYFVARQCTRQDLDPAYLTVQTKVNFSSGDGVRATYANVDNGTGSSTTTNYIKWQIYTPFGIGGYKGLMRTHSDGRMTLSTTAVLGNNATAPETQKGKYLTGILDGTRATAFGNPEWPALQYWIETNEVKTSEWGQHSTIGGYHSGGRNGGGIAECLFGEVQSIRFYNRILSNEELRWNRMIDEQRFNAAANVTVTNVIVAGEYPAGMVEQPGGYKVEGKWTFRARSTFRADGRLMKVSGYTLEYGDAASGTWGAAGALVPGDSFTYTEGQRPALLRLTWHWEPYVPKNVFMLYK